MIRIGSGVVLSLLLLALVGGIILFVWTRSGVSARVEPGRLEQAVALRLRNLAIPNKARAERNPYADQPDAWREAVDHFEEHCAICHGSDGRGSTDIGSGLYPRPPEMTLDRTQRLTDAELYYIIANGVRFTGMPAMGGGDSPEEMWQLVSYIRHLPKQTPEELLDLFRKKRQQELERDVEAQERTEQQQKPLSQRHHHATQ